MLCAIRVRELCRSSSVIPVYACENTWRKCGHKIETNFLTDSVANILKQIQDAILTFLSHPLRPIEPKDMKSQCCPNIEQSENKTACGVIPKTSWRWMPPECASCHPKTLFATFCVVTRAHLNVATTLFKEGCFRCPTQAIVSKTCVTTSVVLRESKAHRASWARMQ